MVSKGSRSTAFKGIFSGGFFPGGFFPGEFFSTALVDTMFEARFARIRIEDSSFNRFALNGIQRDFFGGIFSGGILSRYPEYLSSNVTTPSISWIIKEVVPYSYRWLLFPFFLFTSYLHSAFIVLYRVCWFKPWFKPLKKNMFFRF